MKNIILNILSHCIVYLQDFLYAWNKWLVSNDKLEDIELVF